MTLVLFIRPTKRSVNDYDIMCSKSRTFVSMLELCGVDHDPQDYIGPRESSLCSRQHPLGSGLLLATPPAL